jgi:hypothetical protein
MRALTLPFRPMSWDNALLQWRMRSLAGGRLMIGKTPATS